MIEQRLLNRLKEEQAQYALQSLRHPSTRDAFEYGYRAGVVGGLEKATDILLNLLEEDTNDDNEL